MSETTDPGPLRPRGADRHAANAAAAAGLDAYPTRRARRAAEAAAAAAEAAAAAAAAAAADRAPTSTAIPQAAIRATDQVAHQTTGAVASPPAAPVSTAQPLPSRRALRPEQQGPRPADLGRALTQAITLPLRSIGSAVSSAKAVPLTATAVVACLVVSVATPQAAMATVPAALSTSDARALLPALDVQDYTNPTASALAAQRDAFGSTLTAPRPTVVADTASSRARAVAAAVRPVAGTIPAAGGFGSRWVRGCGACSTNHQGLDFAAPIGTAVVAVMPGRVVSAGVFGGYGNQVLLQHADGSQTRYGHLSRIDVRPGATVGAGQRLGAVGNTGVSTGAHLHFEVLVGGGPIDPARWLADRGLL